MGLEVTNIWRRLNTAAVRAASTVLFGENLSSWPGERPGQPEEGVAAAGGDGDPERQGGRLPGALHRPRNRPEREVLGPLREGPTLGPHSRAPHWDPTLGSHTRAPI